MTTASLASTKQDFSFVLYTSAQTKSFTLYLSNAYPEESVMIFGIFAWNQWHTGTREASHNIQMKLHIFLTLCWPSRLGDPWNCDFHLPDYVTG